MNLLRWAGIAAGLLACATAAKAGAETRLGGADPGKAAVAMTLGALQTSDRGISTSARSSPTLLAGWNLSTGHPDSRSCKERSSGPFEQIDADLWLSLEFDRGINIRQNGSDLHARLAHLGCVERAGRITTARAGLFTGASHFRPGLGSADVRWDKPLVETRPHLQYYTWKIAGPRAAGTGFLGPTSMAISGAVFPTLGANSSLHLHNVDEVQETLLPPVFRSRKATKQNYYFSYGGAADFDLALSSAWGGQVAFRQDFFHFRPLPRRSDLWDFVSLTSTTVSYDLTARTAVQLGHSFLKLFSGLNGSVENHAWHSLLWSILWKPGF